MADDKVQRQQQLLARQLLIDLAGVRRRLDYIEQRVQELAEPYLVLLRSVEGLELTIRAANCLKVAGILEISDLAQCTEGELLRLPNFGRRCLNEVKEALASRGLELGTKLDSTARAELTRLRGS